MTEAAPTTPHEPRRHRKWHLLASETLMVLLVTIIVTTTYSLAVEMRGLGSSGQLATRQRLRQALTRALLTKPDVASISDWMTFDYLNLVFKLPPTYLKDYLGVTDARYPRLSIRRYAATRQLSPSIAVQGVQAAIRNFQAIPTTPKPQ
jgi:hypothetical protein